jgi:hypothetical protein
MFSGHCERGPAKQSPPFSKLLAGAVAALALLLAPAAAQALDARSFERLPASHSAYELVRELEEAGYFTGAQGGAFNGKRQLTRYEFAVAVERMYRGLQPRVAAAVEADTLPGEIRRFRRLLREFGPDIAELGHDVPEMNRQLAAIEDRVDRLPDTRPEQPTLFDRPRRYGLNHRLRSPLRNEPAVPALRPLTLRSPAFGVAQPSELRASAGPLIAQLQVSQPDRLDTTPERLPFEDPADALGYRAQLSLPLGRTLLSAFYNREGPLSDRYMLHNPYFSTGPLEGVGGSFTGSLSRFLVQLQAAQLRSQDDDLAEYLYLRGDLDYQLGSGFVLGVGLERTWMGGPGDVQDFSTYIARVGRQFGKNARIELLYRYYQPGRGLMDAGRDLGNSSALTQISVRF